MSQDIEATIDQRPIEATIGDNTIQSTIGDNIIEATIDQRPINATIGEDIQVDVNGAILQMNGLVDGDYGDIAVSNNGGTMTITQTALNSKQNTLVSGTNIKTINNESILGSGNLTISNGGGSTAETFETVSKNLKAYPATLNYINGTLTSIVYTIPTGTITKTLNYTSGTLTSIVLSGNTPAGIDLIKSLGYTGNTLTSITYS